jgi:hypothetical protein
LLKMKIVDNTTWEFLVHLISADFLSLLDEIRTLWVQREKYQVEKSSRVIPPSLILMSSSKSVPANRKQEIWNSIHFKKLVRLRQTTRGKK